MLLQPFQRLHQEEPGLEQGCPNALDTSQERDTQPCQQSESPNTHRKLCEGRIGDMFSKGIFLELQQLHHQPSQRFIGRSICLNILQDKKHTFVGDREAGSEGWLPSCTCRVSAFWDPCVAGKGWRGVRTGEAPSKNIFQASG